MYVVCTHIGEKRLCGILVTGYCIFAPLVVDCLRALSQGHTKRLSVFNDISWVYCTMKVANEIQCVHTVRITNKWYYFIFHCLQNQVLLPVLRLYLSQMEMVGNTGLGCCF